MVDIVTARLDAKSDSYLATLPSLRLNDVRIGDSWCATMTACSPAAPMRR
jgi:hypothetical protein